MNGHFTSISTFTGLVGTVGCSTGNFDPLLTGTLESCSGRQAYILEKAKQIQDNISSCENLEQPKIDRQAAKNNPAPESKRPRAKTSKTGSLFSKAKPRNKSKSKQDQDTSRDKSTGSIKRKRETSAPRDTDIKNCAEELGGKLLKRITEKSEANETEPAE